MPQFVQFKMQTLSCQYFCYSNIMIMILKYIKKRIYRLKYHRLENLIMHIAL